MKKVVINLGTAKEIVNLGVRRAAVFMGLGLNAANDNTFINYELTNLSNINLVPSNLDINEIIHYKQIFASWIVTCGLRELIERFSVFLDEIYRICLLMVSATKSNELIIDEKKFKKFSRHGLKDKLDTLNAEFDFNSKYKECLLSVNTARNCLAHHRGIVREIDCDIGTFIIKWKAIEIFAEKHSGEIIIIDFPFPKDGVTLSSGEALKYRFTEKQLVFRVGDFITLSPHNLAEICYFINIASDEVANLTLNFANNLGIPLEDSPNMKI